MPEAGAPLRALSVALVGYSAILAVALLAPTSGLQSALVTHVRDLGMWLGFSPTTATQRRAEFLCNALILVPVSWLGSAVWPRTTWRDWTAIAFLVAGSVELAQGLLLPLRDASATDVVANTLGALGGALVASVARRLARASRRP